MNKRGGIVRNRTVAIKEAKQSNQRKKTRFQAFYKQDEYEQKPASLTALTTNQSLSIIQKGVHSDQYDRAKACLLEVSQIRKNKIKVVARNRLMTFKDSEIKRLDENINRLAQSAMSHISSAQKILNWLRHSKSESEIEQKFIRNMEKSLAFDIRQSTKGFRIQQKEFFDSIKNYERQGQNRAVHLTDQMRQKLKDNEDQVQIYQEIERERDQQVNKLVTSINKLSNIYKEMNELVIDQGSLIDRIDYNLDESVQHTKKGVQHLVKAEQHQHSPFADRIIKVMVTMILMLAMIMAYKYSK